MARSLTTSQTRVSRNKGLRSLINWSAVLFGARVLGAIATYAAHVMIARWLGAEALGQYALAFSVLVIAGLVATAGFAEGAPRFIGVALAQDNGGLAVGYLRRARQVTLMNAILIGGLGAFLWHLYGNSGNAVILLVALAAVPFFALLRLHSAVAQALGHLALKEFPNSVLRPVLFALAIALGWSMTLALEATSVMIIHGFIILLVAGFQIVQVSRILRSRTKGRAATFDDRAWFATAPMLVLAGALYTYLPELTNLIVSPYLPSAELAYLNAAMRTAMLVMFAFYAVDAAFLPRATQLFSDQSNLQLEKWVLQAAILKTLVAGTVLLLSPFGAVHVLALFGSGFDTAAPALQIFAAGLFLRTAIGPPLQLLILSNQQAACVKASIVSFLVLVAGAAVLTPLFGITGAALSTAISMTVWAICLVGPARRGIGFHPGPLSWLAARATTVRPG